MDFILPEVWYIIATTEEENTIITNWMNCQLDKIGEPALVINYLGNSDDIFNSKFNAGRRSGIKITFDQFQNYFNIEQEIDTDLSSLKLLLENINKS